VWTRPIITRPCHLSIVRSHARRQQKSRRPEACDCCTSCLMRRFSAHLFEGALPVPEGKARQPLRQGKGKVSRSPLHGTHSTGCGGGTNCSPRAPKGGRSRVQVRRVSTRNRGNASRASPSRPPRTSISSWTGLIRSAQRLPRLKPGMRPQVGHSCQPKPQRQFLTLPTMMQQNNPGFSGPAGLTERHSRGGGPAYVDHDEYDRDA
jgi:hypothetical protein